MKDFDELVRYATMAPSGHNTQPWNFAIDGDTILLVPDLTRRLPVVDPDEHGLYISLGCALENFAIAAGHFGYWIETDYCELGDCQGCLRIRLRPSRSSIDGTLFHAIPLRQTNRSRYDGRPLPESHIEQLVEASRGDGVRAVPFLGVDAILQLVPFVEQATRAQMADREFVSELLHWIRFTRRESEAKRDGLSAPAMGLPNVPRWLGRLLMRTLVGPTSEARRQVSLLRSCSAALLFVAVRNDPPHWVELGRAFERMALRATALGVQHAHVNMPCEVLSVRRQMESALGLRPGHSLLLVRLGYALPMGRSLRRPLRELLIDAQ